MNNPQGIIIFGANGSGKTILGKELAHILGFKHMDVEIYHFEESEIPYTVERSREDCLRLMLADIEKHRLFVIAAVTDDFGDTIPSLYKLAVHITAPLEVRIERIKRRAYEQHGERICEGGDMHEQTVKFIDFVSSRSLLKINQWAESITCPVMHIDGMIDWRMNAKNVAKVFQMGLFSNKQ